MQHDPQHIYEAFRESMLAKNEEWKNYLADNVKLAGPLAQVAGKAAFIAVNTPFFASIKSSELIEMVLVDDYVITQIITTVNTPKGDELSLEVSEWYEIKAGQLQSLRVYFDTAAFRTAFGM